MVLSLQYLLFNDKGESGLYSTKATLPSIENRAHQQPGFTRLNGHVFQGLPHAMLTLVLPLCYL